jgi:hypothetical protein
MRTELKSEDLNERDILGGLDIDGRIILKRIIKKYGGRVWTGSVRDQWRALVNTVMNFLVS